MVTLDVEFDFLGNNVVIRKVVKLNLRYGMSENKLTVTSITDVTSILNFTFKKVCQMRD